MVVVLTPDAKINKHFEVLDNILTARVTCTRGIIQILKINKWNYDESTGVKIRSWIAKESIQIEEFVYKQFEYRIGAITEYFRGFSLQSFQFWTQGSKAFYSGKLGLLKAVLSRRWWVRQSSEVGVKFWPIRSRLGIGGTYRRWNNINKPGKVKVNYHNSELAVIAIKGT